MQADPLQQLRDVHLPAEPIWWPPAPGWWLLGIALAIAGLWLARLLLKRYRYRQPFNSALRLHQQLRIALNAQEISITEYLHSANGLLKRVFIYGQGDAHSAALSGERWLAHLDSYSSGTPFTNGAGILLSQRRFAGQLHASDAAQVNKLQRAIDEVLQAASSQSTSEHQADD